MFAFATVLLLLAWLVFALMEIFCLWHVCTYGGYNANFFYQVMQALLFFPTRVILAFGLVLLTYDYYGLSWQFGAMVIISIPSAHIAMMFLRFPVMRSYRKKLRESETVVEQVGHQLESHTATKLDTEPTLKRSQATIKRPSA